MTSQNGSRENQNKSELSETPGVTAYIAILLTYEID